MSTRSSFLIIIWIFALSGSVRERRARLILGYQPVVENLDNYYRILETDSEIDGKVPIVRKPIGSKNWESIEIQSFYIPNYGSSKDILKTAPPSTGVIAGGEIR